MCKQVSISVYCSTLVCKFCASKYSQSKLMCKQLLISEHWCTLVFRAVNLCCRDSQEGSKLFPEQDDTKDDQEENALRGQNYALQYIGNPNLKLEQRNSWFWREWPVLTKLRPRWRSMVVLH